MPVDTDSPDVQLSTLSAALDEIYWLRSESALVAASLDAQLRFSTLPVETRRALTEAVRVLRGCACGEVSALLEGVSSEDRKEALRAAGARPIFTRTSFERELFGKDTRVRDVLL